MRPFAVIVALLLISLNAHAALSKWVDADGKVHYSDTPPPAAKTETVRNISGKGQADAPASYTPKSLAEREAELKKSKQEKADAEQKKEKQKAEAETKKQNCSIARENARTLEESSRIVTYDANGERTFLDDSAREQRLAEARKAISENCN